jgi:hypothetical protein
VTEEATEEMRDYLLALASKLATLISPHDPLPERIVEAASKWELDADYAATLTEAAEDAIAAFENGEVVLGPWTGAQYL